MKEQNKKKLRNRIIFGIVVLVIIASLYGYIRIKNNKVLKEQIQISTAVQGQYDGLFEKIKNEQDRCSDFIAQGTGDFADFEYCKKFLAWSESF